MGFTNLFVLFFIVILCVHAETNSTTKLPTGLPKVEWTILRIDPPFRENLCQRQIAYCSNNCGGPSQAKKNFCNAESMAWNCTCNGPISDFLPFAWPVAQTECSGKAQDCQMECSKDTDHPNSCAALCNAYYQCGTDRAPPSFLETENPNDTPSYDGPKKITQSNTTATNSTTTNHTNNPTTTATSEGIHLKCFSAVIPLLAIMIALV